MALKIAYDFKDMMVLNVINLNLKKMSDIKVVPLGAGQGIIISSIYNKLKVTKNFAIKWTKIAINLLKFSKVKKAKIKKSKFIIHLTFEMNF